MEKKKLLLIIEAMSGGAGRHVQDLILNLNPQKFDIYCVYSKGRADENFLSQLSKFQEKATMIECNFLVREITLKKDFKAFREVTKIINQINPDIVHCHSSKAGVIGRIAAKRNKIEKIFYTPHAFSFMAPEFSNKKKKLFVIIEKWLIKKATSKVFCVSESEMLEALKYGVGNKNSFEVIYNGLPIINLPTKKAAKKKLGISEETFVIGNNARLSKQKDPFLFIELANKIISSHPNIKFVWLGDGPLEAILKQKVKDYHLDNSIKFLGFRSETEKLVCAYDLFLITSEYEGLPYAPIEALRASVPIIATKVSGNIEIVEEGISGIFIDKNNFDDAVKNINTLISNNYITKKIDLKQVFKKKFSIEKMLFSIEKEYLG